MMDADKKTADEIVRALRCCGNADTKKPDCEHCPLLSTRMCVKVMLEGAAALIESLQTQLTSSQRREQAAVEDIMCRDHCDVCISGKEHDGECKTADYNCLICKSTTCMCRECRNEDHWKWRGPQAGKGVGE